LNQSKSSQFPQPLLHWFDQYGRKNLPWQGNNSYYVWVSEIMLQQTQVLKVIDYFNRFIEKFPSLQSLAQAVEPEVLQLWSGLGYYNRARNLHKAAIICQQQHKNKLPLDLQKLMALPGIGRTTAGAIMSLAYNQPFAILDGNVKRVLSRVFMIKAEKVSHFNKLLWTKAEECMEQKRARDYNQAIMDLGAIICTKNSPKCELCPFSLSCKARKNQQVNQYPQTKKPIKKLNKTLRTVMLLYGNQVFLQQRLSTGIWPQLWFLPCYETQNELNNSFIQLNKQKLQVIDFSISHILTHRNLLINVSCIRLTSEQKEGLNASGQWIKVSDFQSLPHPKALEKIVDKYNRNIDDDF
jgi:A/G-specific adenine glycosylase